MRFRIFFVASCLALTGLSCSSRAPQTSSTPETTPLTIPESHIGLRQADVLETSPAPPIVPVTADPGEAPLPKTPYQGSPPVIPHSVDGILPITAAENACFECHNPEAAPDSGATPIPSSHFKDGDLDTRRYLCIFCHAPQTKTAPLVANRFQP